MRQGSLSEELDAITIDFDYGIVPGSATVFVKDEMNGIGRLDLTLLEGVMVVIEVTTKGYKVVSCSPLSLTEPAKTTVQLAQERFEKLYDTMETLLMEISPLFKLKFEEMLHVKLKAMQSIIDGEEQDMFINNNNNLNYDWYQ